MDKKNIPITVMADGKDAILVIHGILEEDGMLDKLYARVGEIADAALYGTVEAEPVTKTIQIDTSNERFQSGEYKGLTPYEVTQKEGDKGYLGISALEDSVEPKLALAIRREKTRYLKWRFSKIEDANAYAAKLSEGQLNMFLSRYDGAVTEKMRKDISDVLGIEHYEDARDYGSAATKRIIVSTIIDYYKK